MVEQRILRLLRKAALRAERRTAGMAREMLDHADYLWTFVSNEGIDPTNNAAERAIRPAVLWRKGSFGTGTAESTEPSVSSPPSPRSSSSAGRLPRTRLPRSQRR